MGFRSVSIGISREELKADYKTLMERALTEFNAARYERSCTFAVRASNIGSSTDERMRACALLIDSCIKINNLGFLLTALRTCDKFLGLESRKKKIEGMIDEINIEQFVESAPKFKRKKKRQFRTDYIPILTEDSKVEVRRLRRKERSEYIPDLKDSSKAGYKYVEDAPYSIS